MNQRRRDVVVGLDAGGTRTRAVLATADDGRPVGEGAAGPGNALTVPLPQLTEHLAEAIGRAVPEQVRDRVVAVAGGFAGATGAADEPGRRNALAALTAALHRLGIDAGPPVIGSDIEAAFASAPGAPADGLALVAGTGAVAMRITGRRGTVTVDGDGWLLGDDGSGFWIGRAAVRAALRMADGRGAPTVLAEAVGRELGVPADALPGGASGVAGGAVRRLSPEVVPGTAEGAPREGRQEEVPPVTGPSAAGGWSAGSGQSGGAGDTGGRSAGPGQSEEAGAAGPGEAGAAGTAIGAAGTAEGTPRDGRNEAAPPGTGPTAAGGRPTRPGRSGGAGVVGEGSVGRGRGGVVGGAGGGSAGPEQPGVAGDAGGRPTDPGQSGVTGGPGGGPTGPGQAGVAEGSGQAGVAGGNAQAGVAEGPGQAGVAGGNAQAGVAEGPGQAGVAGGNAQAGVAEGPGQAGVAGGNAQAGVAEGPRPAGVAEGPGQAGMAGGPGQAGVARGPGRVGGAGVGPGVAGAFGVVRRPLPPHDHIPWSRPHREAYRRHLLPVVMAEAPIRLARLAPLVVAAARDAGDPVALAILDEAADQLTETVRALEPRAGERVVATGGLLGPDGPLTDRLEARLRPLGLTLDWVPDGCRGAVALARLAHGGRT
ncbi:N-acetylglucosamine kinase-like BadF-type ATPase [Streptomyces africanus]|uniref:N-acetylglucosamine kinase-like BadF-type ATPase n=1 Tax=Streptomyces africanus TaxID=231024 RepID=A0ABU0QXK5_9ACTN|nr:BadF/BadG/BcrA/BcrD ATPase family protein [Streptomyces africanus]MDQ0752139.1 N-acetylglucosamine kinase-like BadF-type ATPase [Streptomyces africanus]